MSTGDLKMNHFGVLDGFSSDEDSEVDEAEKFVKQTMKNQILRKNDPQLKESGEKNLLLLHDEEEDDFGSRTPK